MSIPKHTEIRIPVLNYLKQNGTSSSKEMELPLANEFKLTEEEVSRMYESGNGPMFRDRISWALTYLGIADLVQRPKRGVYEITNTGIELLKKPNEIDVYIDKKVEEREKFKKGITNLLNAFEPVKQTKATPQEDLYQSYEKIKKSIIDEILDTVISKSSRDFERLVVQLLQKMGYGGEVKDSGIVTKATNDNGIDGIIKEDILGLGRIHIQAKRYATDNSVGREEIQKFVGALAVAQSNKGVFITTSYYSKGALEYVKNLNGRTNIVLINGEELAEYIYNYDLGMQVEQTITLKKLDIDFWDAMQDK
jgi:restriction system protein